MKLSYRMWTLPLFAGLVIASAMACSESGTAADPTGTGGAATDGGSTATEGGATNGGTSATEGGSTSGTTTVIPAAGTQYWEFADSEEGFKAVYGKQYDPADPTSEPAADILGAALKTATTVEWSSKAGYGGDVGYVAVTIPFAATQVNFQGVDIGIEKFTVPLDLSGKTVSCRAKLVSGMKEVVSGNFGGGKLVLKSGDDWVYASGDYVAFADNTSWVELKITVDSPAEANDGFDPTKIVQMAVSVNTPGAPVTTPVAVETPGLLQIDHCWY